MGWGWNGLVWSGGLGGWLVEKDELYKAWHGESSWNLEENQETTAGRKWPFLELGSFFVQEVGTSGSRQHNRYHLDRYRRDTFTSNVFVYSTIFC